MQNVSLPITRADEEAMNRSRRMCSMLAMPVLVAGACQAPVEDRPPDAVPLSPVTAVRTAPVATIILFEPDGLCGPAPIPDDPTEPRFPALPPSPWDDMPNACRPPEAWEVPPRLLDPRFAATELTEQLRDAGIRTDRRLDFSGLVLVDSAGFGTRFTVFRGTGNEDADSIIAEMLPSITYRPALRDEEPMPAVMGIRVLIHPPGEATPTDTGSIPPIALSPAAKTPTPGSSRVADLHPPPLRRPAG